MNMQPPSMPTIATFIVSVCMAFGIAGTIYAYGHKDPGRIYSPMPLSSEHKDAKKCSDCHDPWKGPSDDKCIKCHAVGELTDPVKNRVPVMHRKAIDGKQSCMECHIEHLGTTGHLTRPFDHAALGANLNCLNCHQTEAPTNDFHAKLEQNCSICHTTESWKNAKFDHDLSAFPLTGKHAQVSCKDCHKGEGFKSLDSSCLSCHQKDDKHQGGMGTSCAQCHSTSTWQDASFKHDRFPISGGDHGGFTCKECHPNQNNYREYTCTSCHEQGRMDRRHSRKSGYIYSSSACFQCHPMGREHGEGGEHEGGRGDDD